MSYPATLPKPPIQAYPFMSMILGKFDREGRCASQSLAHISADEIAAMASTEHVDGNAPPRFCPQQGVDALLAISDETFGRLASILDLRMDHQNLTSSKGELVAHCLEEEKRIQECFEDFTGTHTPEQAQVWWLSAMKGQVSVHWGALADLYNASQDDQKKAISDLFGGCFGFDLKALYTVQAPDISLPAELIPAVRVEQRNDHTWCFNETKDTWQRDDVMQGQFLIEGRASTNYDDHTLIATASTFDEALALATAYTKGIKEKPGFTRLSITEVEYEGTSISDLRLTADLNISPMPNKTCCARLSWNLDRLDKRNRPQSSEGTFKTLLKIEKCFGVKWAQAMRLEHDLGM